MRRKGSASCVLAIMMILSGLVAAPMGLIPGVMADHGTEMSVDLEIDNKTAGATNVTYTFTITLGHDWDQGSLNVTFPNDDAYVDLPNVDDDFVVTLDGDCVNGTSAQDWDDDVRNYSVVPDFNTDQSCDPEQKIELIFSGLKNPDGANSYPYKVATVDNQYDDIESHDFTFKFLPGEPMDLYFASVPTQKKAGESFNVEIVVRDQNGNVNTTAGNITLTLDSSSVELDGKRFNDEDTGSYTFVNLWINKTGEYKLHAVFAVNEETILTNESAPINIRPADDASVDETTISAKPSSILADGEDKSEITVQLKDEFGNKLDESDGEVCLFISDGPGTLEPEAEDNGDCDDKVKALDNGDGTYSVNLTGDTPGDVVVNGTLNGEEITNTVTITVESIDVEPVDLTVVAADENLTADGDSTTLITVTLKDENGDEMDLEGETVCLKTTNGTLSGDSGGCSGGVEAVYDDGKYTSTLTSSTLAGIVTITAERKNSTGSTTITNSTAVAFLPGPPAALEFGEPPVMPIAGEPFTISVSILDAHDNHVGNATNNVTLAIGSGPSGAVLSGTTTIQADNGTATFTGLMVDLKGEYTLEATAPDLDSATSDSFDVLPDIDLAQYNRDLQGSVQVRQVDEGMEVTWDPATYSEIEEYVVGIVVWRINSPAEQIDALSPESSEFQDAIYVDAEGDDSSAYILTLCTVTGAGCYDADGLPIDSLTQVPGYEGASDEDVFATAASPTVDSGFPNLILIILLVAFIGIVAGGAASAFFWLKKRSAYQTEQDYAFPEGEDGFDMDQGTGADSAPRY